MKILYRIALRILRCVLSILYFYGGLLLNMPIHNLSNSII